MKKNENLKKKKLREGQESCVYLVLTPLTCEQLGLYMYSSSAWWGNIGVGLNGNHPSSGVTHMLKNKVGPAYIITRHRGNSFSMFSDNAHFYAVRW